MRYSAPKYFYIPLPKDYSYTPYQLNSLPNSISPFIYKFHTLRYEFHPEIVLIHFDIKLFCSHIL